MSTPSRILELTERFEYNLDSYKKGHYNETQVRLEYINLFMEELAVYGITEFDDSEYLNYANNITRQPIGLEFYLTGTKEKCSILGENHHHCSLYLFQECSKKFSDIFLFPVRYA